MTLRTPVLASLAALMACSRPPAEGTFVGNPELTAAYRSSATYIARGGRLVAPESFLVGCEGEDNVPLGNASFEFQGERSDDVLQIPTGTYCGVFFVVQELTVQFDDGGADLTSVTARDFDLVVPANIVAAPGAQYVLHLADDQWLDALAEYAASGDNVVEGDPDLEGAFFGGLEDDSSVEDTPVQDNEPLEGRLDLGDYPISPGGWPTMETNCGALVNFDMAVPIPPAAMATMGVDGVGWCDSNLDFSADLSPLTASQLDYGDFSTYSVSYNGWGAGCGALHCGQVSDANGVALGRPCSVLAFCDGEGGSATATGFSW